jgi:hypothetical protein
LIKAIFRVTIDADAAPEDGDASEPELAPSAATPPRLPACHIPARLLAASPTTSSPPGTPAELPGTPAELCAPATAPPRVAGEIVHLSRKLCGRFEATRYDGAKVPYVNKWYGFVRPLEGEAAAARRARGQGVSAHDLFLHHTDVAPDYNPKIGDRVLFRFGAHGPRLKAVDVVPGAGVDESFERTLVPTPAHLATTMKLALGGDGADV